MPMVATDRFELRGIAVLLFCARPVGSLLRGEGSTAGPFHYGDLAALQQTTPHSITSSARASSVAGMVRPRAFAVLRLITSSKVVLCWTGRSAGLAPLRIF